MGFFHHSAVGVPVSGRAVDFFKFLLRLTIEDAHTHTNIHTYTLKKDFFWNQVRNENLEVLKFILLTRKIKEETKIKKNIQFSNIKTSEL